MIYLREADVEQLLRPADVTNALEAVFRDLARGEASQQPRQRVVSGAHVLHQLQAISATLGLASSKVYLSGPAGVRFITLLYSLEECSLLATLESARLGQLRTGCATALAARYLVQEPVRKLALLGSGTVAKGQFEALQAEFSPPVTTLWSRKAESRERFLEWAQPHAVQACASVEEAVSGADLVVVATSAGQPVLEGRWLGPAGVLCGVGVNQAKRRELDDEAVRRCSAWVTDDVAQARQEAGDLLLTPDFDWGSLRPLADLVRSGPERRPGGWIGFKSLGVGVEDLATAALVYQKAVQAGLGQRL